MTETLAWPDLEILDSLGCLGAIQVAEQVFAPNDAEDLDVQDVWGGVIVIGGQPVADCLAPRRSDQHFVQAGGVNYQHPATAHAVRRALPEPRRAG